MSVIVGVSVVGVRIPLSRRRIADVTRAVFRSERVGNAFVSVAFVTNPAIRAINKRHLKRDRATDVIAFSYRAAAGRRPPSSVRVCDIYIAPQVARRNAQALGVSIREEIVRLVVHGSLHALGYDHPETDARTRSPMWRKQERLVRRLA